MESEIFWGDGTGDVFKISCIKGSGDQEITIVSDANNTRKTRTKVLTYVTNTTPRKRVTLTITQIPEQQEEQS